MFFMYMPVVYVAGIAINQRPLGLNLKHTYHTPWCVDSDVPCTSIRPCTRCILYTLYIVQPQVHLYEPSAPSTLGTPSTLSTYACCLCVFYGACTRDT